MWPSNRVNYSGNKGYEKSFWVFGIFLRIINEQKCPIFYFRSKTFLRSIPIRAVSGYQTYGCGAWRSPVIRQNLISSSIMNPLVLKRAAIFSILARIALGVTSRGIFDDRVCSNKWVKTCSWLNFQLTFSGVFSDPN